MSAPVMSPDFANLMGSLGGGYSSGMGQVGNGSGSGVLNFLSGIDFSSIGGSSSGNTGVAGGLSGIASLFGPVGMGAGLVANLIPGLDGFLKNGFDFTCLGSQAYSKQNLDADLKELERIANEAKSGLVEKVAYLLNWCEQGIKKSDIEISKYRSGCSKSLRGKFKDACKQVSDSIPKDSFTVHNITELNWDGVPYDCLSYRPIAGFQNGSTQNVDFSGMTVERFNTELVPQIESYSLANGLNVQESIQTAYSKLFPDGGIFSGGVNGGIDSNGNWHVDASAGNQKPNYLMYIIIALGGFMAYKMLKK